MTDLNCHFTEPFVTKESMKRWPKSCGTVCGNLIFNEKNDLTESRLAQIFHLLTYLNGDLKIENTNFTSLRFLSNLQMWTCDSKEFTIANNPFLSNINGIQRLSASSPCLWSVFNNPRLDFPAFFADSHAEYSGDMNVYGNLKDLGCLQARISPETLPYYQNCTKIDRLEVAALKVTKVDKNMDLSGLLKLTNLTGNLEVFNTNLQNLSFLGNLKYHYAERFQSYNVTNIHDNPNLKRLGWDSLKFLSPDDHGFVLNIENNHPDFCLTTNELQVFAEHSIAFYALEAKFCPELYRKDGQKVCNWGDLSEMSSDCQHVIGEVVIDASNENDVWKLKNMTNVYGSLTIQGTNELVDLSFLAKLRQIATLNMGGHPLLRILSNKKLQKVTLPKMKTSPFVSCTKLPVAEGATGPNPEYEEWSG
uniref:G_PROTEIN_RECEP_F1_2 domain-containing protein n=1 Tax=Caenorhabditis tropicalis TaxID=1561998 RepID=A0A1I7V214_9PELO